MVTEQHLTGVALGHWLAEQLIAPDGKITLNAPALEKARASLSKTKDLKKLRASAQALAGLAEHIGGQRNDVKVGEAILRVVLELQPRFGGAVAERSLARVEAARDTKNLLGGDRVQADVPSDSQPAVPALSFRAAMKG